MRAAWWLLGSWRHTSTFAHKKGRAQVAGVCGGAVGVVDSQLQRALWGQHAHGNTLEVAHGDVRKGQIYAETQFTLWTP